MTAGSCEAEAGGIVVTEEARPAEGFDEQRINVLAQKWHENEKRPQTIDDARNGGQQLGKKGERSAEESRAHFGEENGHPESERNCQEQRQEGSNQSAVNKGQCAEVAVDRIPILRLAGYRIDRCSVEELEPKLRPSKLGFGNQFPGDERDDAKNAERT